MTELEKCYITSAYLQSLCHSGERPVARGPLVEKVTVKKKFHRQQKCMQNYPACKELKQPIMGYSVWIQLAVILL